MGFLDMENFSQAAEDSTVVPHPLAEKLSLEAKTSYLGMVIFAALAAYRTINASEKKQYGLLDCRLNWVKRISTSPLRRFPA